MKTAGIQPNRKYICDETRELGLCRGVFRTTWFFPFCIISFHKINMNEEDHSPQNDEIGPTASSSVGQQQQQQEVMIRFFQRYGGLSRKQAAAVAGVVILLVSIGILLSSLISKDKI